MEPAPSREGPPRWIANASDESGRSEVYVQSHPGSERRALVSTGGGLRPIWSPDGRELLYVSGDDMMSVEMLPDGTFGPPRRLFDSATFLIDDRFQSYSLSPDGRRFLMARRDAGSAPRQLNVILNWSGTAADGGVGSAIRR